jgi:3-phosphoshikimate 1-carboxyvinyltransferase
MLVYLGAPVEADGATVTLDPDGWDRRLRARPITVPGDLSSAAFVVAAAVVATGSVRVRAVGCNPTRTGVLDALRGMGAEIACEPDPAGAREDGPEPVCDLVATGGALRGVTIDGALAVRAIDELPLLAVLGAYAEGTTTIADAAELRVKESDRVAATVDLLRAFGIACEPRADGMIVEGRTGRRPRAGAVDSRGDHRIAMAAAICALGAEGETRVRDVDNVATSFPGFVDTLRLLGVDLALV